MKLKLIHYSIRFWLEDRENGDTHSNPFVSVLNGLVILVTLFRFSIMDLDELEEVTELKKRDKKER